MGLLTGKLRDTVTWWKTTGGSGFGGDSVATPIKLKAKWEEIQEVFIGQIDRRELVSKAVVYVDMDMSVGDYLALGDFTDQANPGLVAGAYKIQRWEKAADLRNADHVRFAVL